MDETRVVEIKIWVNGLTSIQIRPVTLMYANKCLKEVDEGALELDDMPSEFWDKFDFSQDIYFCNGNHVNMTMLDGDKKQEFEELPAVYPCMTNGHESIDEVEEEYGDDGINAWKVLEKVQKTPQEDVELNNPLYSLIKLPGGYFKDYIKAKIKETNSVSEFADDEGINYIQCGKIGKGTVSFYIEIPKDEPFDINKLHFFAEDEWWDQEDFVSCIDELAEDFSSQNVLLMFVEYDGRIYRRQDTEFAPGWKSCCSFFSDNDLRKLVNE